MRSTRLSLAALAVLALVGAAQALAAKPAGEPFFPRAGNEGYDAVHYDARLAYKPKGGRIEAETKIEAVATEALRSFSLDFLGPKVKGVRVGFGPARFRRSPGKLIVTPADPIEKGESFTALVLYEGLPPKVTDPDGSQEGWFRTDDGVIAVGEPQGTAAWIPCNNVPSDKATFRFHITVPEQLKAVANGRRERGSDPGRGLVQMNWVEPAPMSTYLAVLNIGRGRIVKGRAGGLPTWTLIDPRLERGSRGPLAALPEVIAFESRAFGAYPFASAGSLVDFAPTLGYALETQSRPIYAFVPDVTTIVHETAHQWFGDSVGLQRWPQIWLNEGFATWAQWYYAERHGGRSAHAIFQRLSGVPASDERFWNPPPARLGSPKQLFDPTTYVRGAMALQALRQQIGTQPFLRVLRRWTSEHRYGNATIGQFRSLAEEVSGRGLDSLFERWLYRRGKP
ncbi:MAG TPA: M1 family metallopeptidase [Solirubrobacterales bacterium]|nr:M1 family metallopeptidase [Solirubrobacterales bacterium]